jgi:hypothetical protein
MKELSKITIKAITNEKELQQAAQNLMVLKLMKEKAEQIYKEKREKYAEVLKEIEAINQEEKAFIATIKDYDNKIRTEIKNYITALIQEGQQVEKIIPVEGGRVTFVKDIDIEYEKAKVIKMVLQGKLDEDVLEINETKLKAIVANGMKIQGVEVKETVTMRVLKEKGA